MDSDSAKNLSALIREITWNFGPRGLKGECCGDLSQPEYQALCLASERQQCSMQEIANPHLHDIALQIQAKLKKVIENL